MQDERLRHLIQGASLAGFLLVAAMSIRAATLPYDFRAFYCAGSAINAGYDPYRVEPLRTCEYTGSVFGTPRKQGFAVPAPLPGYDIAAFRIIAALPYGTASLLWQLLLWGCVAGTVVAVWKLTGVAPAVLIAAFAFSDGFRGSVSGNLAPIAIVCIAFAALCASQRRYALATISMLLALCEPHIALGPLIAWILFIPSSRLIAFFAVLVLGMLTYATTGITLTAEFFREVLPRQILAEVAFEEQYSLTHLLHLAGVPDRTAILFGDLSFVIVLIVGIITAAKLRARFCDDAFLILIPVAYSLVGGPYLHAFQLPAALPAAFLLYTKAPRYRAILGASIIILAIPWIIAAQLQALQPFVALGVALLAWTFVDNPRIAAAVACGQLILMLGMAFWVTRFFDRPLPHVEIPGTAFVQDAWQPTVISEFSRHAPALLPLKTPTWFALGAIAWAAFAAAKGVRGESREGVSR